MLGPILYYDHYVPLESCGRAMFDRLLGRSKRSTTRSKDDYETINYHEAYMSEAHAYWNRLRLRNQVPRDTYHECTHAHV